MFKYTAIYPIAIAFWPPYKEQVSLLNPSTSTQALEWDFQGSNLGSISHWLCELSHAT